MDAIRQLGADHAQLEGKWALAAAIGAGAIYLLFGTRSSNTEISEHTAAAGRAEPRSQVRAIAETLNARDRKTGNVPPLTHPMQGRMQASA